MKETSKKILDACGRHYIAEVGTHCRFARPLPAEVRERMRGEGIHPSRACPAHRLYTRCMNTPWRQMRAWRWTGPSIPSPPPTWRGLPWREPAERGWPSMATFAHGTEHWGPR